MCTLLHPPDLESSSHVRSQHTRENIGMQMTHGHTILATMISADCSHARMQSGPGVIEIAPVPSSVIKGRYGVDQENNIALARIR